MPWQFNVQQLYGVVLKKKHWHPSDVLNIPWCKVFEHLSENFPSEYMSALAGSTQSCLEKCY